jgi:hypothetical protein
MIRDHAPEKVVKARVSLGEADTCRRGQLSARIFRAEELFDAVKHVQCVGIATTFTM